MPRFAQPLRSAVPPEEHDSYDAVVARVALMFGAEVPEDKELPVGEYWGALLTAPPMAAILSEFGRLVRGAGDRPGSFSHYDREFVDQVLWADWKTNVVQEFHLPDALGVGIRLEAIEALRDGRDEDLTEDELLLATYIRQVVGGTVADDTFAAIHERLGDRGAMEYTGFILLLQFIVRMMQAIDVTTPPDSRIAEMIAGYKDGSTPLPDWREHIH